MTSGRMRPDQWLLSYGADLSDVARAHRRRRAARSAHAEALTDWAPAPGIHHSELELAEARAGIEAARLALASDEPP